MSSHGERRVSLLHLRLDLRHPRGGNARERGDFLEREVGFPAQAVDHQFEHLWPGTGEHRLLADAVLVVRHLPQHLRGRGPQRLPVVAGKVRCRLRAGEFLHPLEERRRAQVDPPGQSVPGGTLSQALDHELQEVSSCY